jgi:hypothetical protein
LETHPLIAATMTHRQVHGNNLNLIEFAASQVEGPFVNENFFGLSFPATKSVDTLRNLRLNGKD